MGRRQEIVDAIRARVALIRTANGYDTDLGAHVFEWKVTAFSEGELPGLCFRDTEQTVAELTGGVRNASLTVEFILGAAAGTATPSIVRQGIGDVVRAIDSDPTWGGLAWDTAIQSDEMFMDHDGKLTGLAKVTAIVKYQTLRAVP
ncbi:MAG: hypothetical protein WC899_10690 [bacterium]|jgi:hypothetical protein